MAGVYDILFSIRHCRINLPNRCYHQISRVAHRAYFLDEDECTRFVDFHDILIRLMLKEREWKDSEDVELARANKRPDQRGKTFATGIETPGYIPQVVGKRDSVRAVRLMQFLQWKPKSPTL